MINVYQSNNSIFLTALIMTYLDVSITSPPTIISSNIEYAYIYSKYYTLLKLNTMSNSQTFPKYLSNTSTYKCINSNIVSSLSLTSTQSAKNRPAYLLYMIL